MNLIHFGKMGGLDFHLRNPKNPKILIQSHIEKEKDNIELLLILKTAHLNQIVVKNISMIKREIAEHLIKIQGAGVTDIKNTTERGLKKEVINTRMTGGNPDSRDLLMILLTPEIV